MILVTRSINRPIRSKFFERWKKRNEKVDFYSKWRIMRGRKWSFFSFLTTIVSLIAKIRGKWKKDFRFSYIFIGTRTAPIGTWPLSSPPSSPSPRSSLESRRNSSRVLIRRLFGFARIEFPRFILSQMDRWMDEYHPVLWFLSIDEKKILEEKNIVGNFVFSPSLNFYSKGRLLKGKKVKFRIFDREERENGRKIFDFLCQLTKSIREIDEWHNFHARRKKTILSIITIINNFPSFFLTLHWNLVSKLTVTSQSLNNHLNIAVKRRETMIGRSNRLNNFKISSLLP